MTIITNPCTYRDVTHADVQRCLPPPLRGLNYTCSWSLGALCVVLVHGGTGLPLAQAHITLADLVPDAELRTRAEPVIIEGQSARLVRGADVPHTVVAMIRIRGERSEYTYQPEP